MDIYKTVTDQIIAALESDRVPWIKPWNDTAEPLGMPHNRVSKNQYNGINTLLLWCAKIESGYSSDSWLTFKQAKDLGGTVKKGEHGSKIVFFKPLEKTNKDGEKESFCMARGYTVFNLDQCEGIDPITKPVHSSIAESIMLDVARAVGARVDIEGNRACFIPSVDVIKMPHQSQFKTPDNFEATLAHELTHWTGHKSRIDRNLTGRFGSESYAAEELIAEMGAAFISAEMGFNISELQHPQYIANWLKVLKNDKRAIFTAASQAQKACNYIKDAAITESVAA